MCKERECIGKAGVLAHKKQLKGKEPDTLHGPAVFPVVSRVDLLCGVRTASLLFDFWWCHPQRIEPWLGLSIQGTCQLGAALIDTSPQEIIARRPVISRPSDREMLLPSDSQTSGSG